MKKNGMQLLGTVPAETAFILSPAAMDFLTHMERHFREERQLLLKKREARQALLDNGGTLDFLAETANIREGNWRLDHTPHDLQDRRVEITGPVERKMMINALNSGARVFMADFEDSNAPTFANCMRGQRNLFDAVRKTITFTDPGSGKHYALNEETAVLMVRPRGWHLDEAHVLVDGEPMSASLFDALLYLFHNAEALSQHGTGPYYYLPKMESHLEARLWAEVFTEAERFLQIAHGTIKATVLIETIPAAFEMDEIIYALRDYITGLNCGRWDYIFSFIKKFRNHPDCILPNRSEVTMTSPFLAAYVSLLIQTCHRRGIHAMGGMAAQIPIRNDEAANREAFQRVLEDKTREVNAGHDGTWVAHPGLIPVAMEAFDRGMQGPNQLSRYPEMRVQREDLLRIPHGKITEDGIQSNIRVALLYLKSWLLGNGCVPVKNLMEDAATAEICRAQLWQWLHFAAPVEGVGPLTESRLRTMMETIFQEEKQAVTENRTETQALIQAHKVLDTLIFGTKFEDFLTTVAYPYLIEGNRHGHTGANSAS